MLLITTATAPSCQLVALHEEQQRRRRTRRPTRSRHVPLLAAGAVDERADDRQHEGAGDRGEAGQVERQRPGGEVQAEQVDGLACRCRRRRRSRRRLPGDRDHVRREQHREHGRVEGRVGPVVPVPGLLLLEPVDGGRGRRCRTVPRCSRWSLHCPRSISTSLSTSVRSVIRPSTPRSSSSSISAGSSTVHTCTWRAGRVGPAYEPAVTTGSRPRRCGTCSAATRPRVTQPASRPTGGSQEQPPPRPGPPRSRPGRAVARRKASIRRCENEPTQTRSWRRVRSSRSASGGTAPCRLQVDVEPAVRGTRRAARPSSARRARRRSGPAATCSAVELRRARRAVGDPVQRRRRGRRAARRRGSRARRSRGSGSRARPRAGRRAGCSPAPGISGCRAPPRCAIAITDARLVEHRVEVGEPGHWRGAPRRARGHASSIHRHAAMVLPNRRRGPSAFLLRRPRGGGVPCEAWTS